MFGESVLESVFSHSLALSYTLSLSLSQSFTLSVFYSLSLLLSQSFTLSLRHSLTPTLPHPYTLTTNPASLLPNPASQLESLKRADTNERENTNEREKYKRGKLVVVEGAAGTRFDGLTDRKGEGDVSEDDDNCDCMYVRMSSVNA